MILLKLFTGFFKTGLFAVGGGMATVPFLIKLSQETEWFTAAELANMIAVSESTPGPIGVNMATYAGFTTAGIPGALVASLGLVLPSFLIILIIAMFLNKFHENPIVKNSFYFLRACASGLLLYALYKVFQIAIFPDNKVSLLNTISLAVFIFVIFHFKKVHPIIWILVGAVFGLIAL